MVSHSLQSAGAIIQLDNDIKPWYARPPKTFLDHVDADVTEVVWDANLQGANTKLVDDATFRRICSFRMVWNITLDDCTVTDASLDAVKNLPCLSVLRFRNSQIGDEGVRRIVEHTQIENLVLANSSVTDDCAAEFRSLPKLYYLDLSGTAITDKAVPELAKNSGLTYLDLRGTGVTSDGVERLKAELPHCKIEK